MKITFDKEKTKEALSGFMRKTAEISRETAANAKTGLSNMVEKSKEDSYARRMKKYNPLFPDEYHSDGFKLPNNIMIVDDAVRRDIDVCEGAIGWRNSDTGTEVLYLYDEFVAESGITFIPRVICDATYCVDSFDRSRYIQAECIFGMANDERLAELDHIAYCLGAQRYTIEVESGETEETSEDKSISLNEKAGAGKDKASATEGLSISKSSSSGNHRSGMTTTEFKNNQNLQRPTLKWFEHDVNIKNLIDIRLNEHQNITSKVLIIQGSSCATMTQKTACALDALISGIKVTASCKMANASSKEHNTVLKMYLEFE